MEQGKMQYFYSSLHPSNLKSKENLVGIRPKEECSPCFGMDQKVGQRTAYGLNGEKKEEKGSYQNIHFQAKPRPCTSSKYSKDTLSTSMMLEEKEFQKRVSYNADSNLPKKQNQNTSFSYFSKTSKISERPSNQANYQTGANHFDQYLKPSSGNQKVSVPPPSSATDHASMLAVCLKHIISRNENSLEEIGNIFEEVIRAVPTYGKVLREIKILYENKCKPHKKSEIKSIKLETVNKQIEDLKRGSESTQKESENKILQNSSHSSHTRNKIKIPQLDLTKLPKKYPDANPVFVVAKSLSKKDFSSKVSEEGLKPSISTDCQFGQSGAPKSGLNDLYNEVFKKYHHQKQVIHQIDNHRQ